VLEFAVKPNEAIEVPIAYEDAHLLVVNKPAGMVTQPGKGHTSDSLLNGLFARHGKLLQNLGVRRDFGLLHRLDRETSGLLVVAKSPNAYDQLRRDFEARHVDKEYVAITVGTPKPMQGVVQARLKEVVVPAPDAKYAGATVKKVIISQQGQEAISAYQTLATSPTHALVKVNIKTGRLHQIRAHMQFLNVMVAGDDVYTLTAPKGAKLPNPPRLALHAWHLGFKHPITEKWAHVYAALPKDLTLFAAKVGLALPAQVAESRLALGQ